MGCDNTSGLPQLGCCEKPPWRALSVQAVQYYWAWAKSTDDTLYRRMTIEIYWSVSGQFVYPPAAHYLVVLTYDPHNPSSIPSTDIQDDTRDMAYETLYNFQGSAWNIELDPPDSGWGNWTGHRNFIGRIDGINGAMTASVTITLDQEYVEIDEAQNLLNQKDLLSEALPAGCGDYNWSYSWDAGTIIETKTTLLDTAPWAWLLGLPRNPAQRVPGQQARAGAGRIMLGGYSIWRDWDITVDGLTEFTFGALGNYDGPYKIYVTSHAQKIRLIIPSPIALREYIFGARPPYIYGSVPPASPARTAWEEQALNPVCNVHPAIQRANPHPICPELFGSKYLDLVYGSQLTVENDMYTFEAGSTCP